MALLSHRSIIDIEDLDLNMGRLSQLVRVLP